MPAPDRDVLLLDGDCGLCHGLARFIDLKLKSGVDIAYWLIESEDAQNLIATFPKWQQQSDTVFLFQDGRSYIRSAAVIRCLLYMIWYWKIWFLVLWIIPLPIRNMVYQIVAKYRHRIFKKPEVCTFRID